ncbi:hypothetical protein [Streptomyces sp. NPDC058092]|uniref:hypothetical protein n=1 Tax=Streptomyces sp. NPDC058092 TaxID=3346336 RepID=UPI0036EDDAB0
MVEKGWTISAIALRLNLDRKTVRRFRDTNLDELPASARDRRPDSVLEPFKAYLNSRFTEPQGQVSGTRLFLEVRPRTWLPRHPPGRPQAPRRPAVRHRRTGPG